MVNGIIKNNKVLQKIGNVDCDHFTKSYHSYVAGYDPHPNGDTLIFFDNVLSHILPKHINNDGYDLKPYFTPFRVESPHSMEENMITIDNNRVQNGLKFINTEDGYVNCMLSSKYSTYVNKPICLHIKVEINEGDVLETYFYAVSNDNVVAISNDTDSVMTKEICFDFTNNRIILDGVIIKSSLNLTDNFVYFACTGESFNIIECYYNSKTPTTLELLDLTTIEEGTVIVTPKYPGTTPMNVSLTAIKNNQTYSITLDGFTSLNESIVWANILEGYLYYRKTVSSKVIVKRIPLTGFDSIYFSLESPPSNHKVEYSPLLLELPDEVITGDVEEETIPTDFNVTFHGYNYYMRNELIDTSINQKISIDFTTESESDGARLGLGVLIPEYAFEGSSQLIYVDVQGYLMDFPTDFENITYDDGNVHTIEYTILNGVIYGLIDGDSPADDEWGSYTPGENEEFHVCSMINEESDLEIVDIRREIL